MIPRNFAQEMTALQELLLDNNTLICERWDFDLKIYCTSCNSSKYLFQVRSDFFSCSLPTVSPSTLPTSKPTVSPTVTPSNLPTISLTVLPTNSPTVSPISGLP